MVRFACFVFLLIFICRRTMQVEMYDIRSRDNKDHLQIRNSILIPKCTQVTPGKLMTPLLTTTTTRSTTTRTSSARPIMARVHNNCTRSHHLETSTQRVLFSNILPSKVAPKDTLEDINSYCQLLEKAFQLAKPPTPDTQKYSEPMGLHFADSPLLKPPQMESQPITPDPCEKVVPVVKEIPKYKIPTTEIPISSTCQEEHPDKQKVSTLPNIIRSPLSSPPITPQLYKNIFPPDPIKPQLFHNNCPPDDKPNGCASKLKQSFQLPEIDQSRLLHLLKLYNDQYSNFKWTHPPQPGMQYPNNMRPALEYGPPVIPRYQRFIDETGNVNFNDEVRVRLPLADDAFGVNDRIIGGTKALSKEIPYQVALYKLDYFICGSSLISQFYILTAGHCLESIQVQDLWFRVGSEHLLKGGQTYKVRDFSIHSNYNQTDFDIALIRSASSIKFGPAVIPISLPSFADVDLPNNVEVIGSGWGATQTDKNKKGSYTLHKIILRTVSRGECKHRIMPTKNKIGNRQICTNLPIEAGMCFGDSGGPLVYNKKLVGIVSWGSPCAIGDADVYTNIREFLPWIYCEMKKLDYKDSN